jgi:hypothetical protein
MTDDSDSYQFPGLKVGGKVVATAKLPLPPPFSTADSNLCDVPNIVLT